MSVFKPRNRLVYFRMSEEEFEQFNTFCRSHGARSLSDMARIAVQNTLQDNGSLHTDSITQRLDELNAAVYTLKGQLEQLNQLLKERSNGKS